MLVAVRPVLLEKVDIIFGNAEQQSPFSLFRTTSSSHHVMSHSHMSRSNVPTEKFVSECPIVKVSLNQKLANS